MGILTSILVLSCKNSTLTKTINTKQIWSLKTLKNRSKENLNVDKWNKALLAQDLKTYNEYADIFEKYPLNNYPFPVADYDYAVYSNPFSIKIDDIIFKGIQIGEYNDSNSNKITTKLTLIVLTNNDNVEPESFVDSRNYPYLTAEGNFDLSGNKFKWVFSATPDGFSSLFFSMKFFDLRFGETIIIYPQKDNSFFYEQIDESPNKYVKFEDYIKKVKENKRNLNRLNQKI